MSVVPKGALKKKPFGSVMLYRDNSILDHTSATQLAQQWLTAKAAMFLFAEQ